MITDWNLRTVFDEINKISRAESDSYMDGYVTWGCKQDLYQILWHVQNKLDKCSVYVGEDDYKRNHEKKQTWKALTK